MRQHVFYRHCLALQNDYRVAGVYLLDSQFLDDPTKYFSGVLAALSAMVNLEIPHVNVMTKMDMVVRLFSSSFFFSFFFFFGWLCNCYRVFAGQSPKV